MGAGLRLTNPVIRSRGTYSLGSFGLVTFDWQNPDYVPVFKQRAERLARLQASPALAEEVRYYYRTHIDDFVNDWGITVDTRVASQGRSPIMPMVLFPKQREFLQWLFARWKKNEPGVGVKSRDVGISWLAMGFSIGLATLYDDVSIGFGSEKEDKVDRSGDPDCLFYKGRMFLRYLPEMWRGGWSLSKTCSSHMRLVFPNTGSSITGEAGDNIGRGGRKAVYFVDESAHVPNPKAIDASLSATTDVRVDLSSVRGMANSFAERAHNPDIPRFDFAKEDDPRRTPEYWDKKKKNTDPVVFAAEYDRNFSASIEGVVIPAVWVSAAIDAHKVLGLTPKGRREGALDVADAGRDLNAFCIGYDFLVEHVESWRGSEDHDIFHTVERAFTISTLHNIDEFQYDADGLGAGVRGDARKINEARDRKIIVTAYRGSGGVFKPEQVFPGTERKAEDFFENLKAQAWWGARNRFQYTHRCVAAVLAGERIEIDTDQIISISKEIPERAKLQVELSQVVWGTSKHGKVMVDKCPVGTKAEVRNNISSPNLADSVIIRFAPRTRPISIHSSLMQGASHVVPLRR